MNKLNKRSLIITIVCILAVFFLFRGCYSSSAQKSPPITVGVSPVIQKNVTVDVTAIGNVEAYSTVSIKSQVEGVVLSVGFEEGDMVKKGQLLFKIDPRPFEIALAQSQANLARDEAQLKTATLAMERNKPLLQKGYVSAQAFDELSNNVTALAATEKADKAAVENAQLQLSYSTIYSPIAGRTGVQLVEPGNLVKANDAVLVVINEVTPVSIVFTLPEETLHKIQKAYSQGELDILISPDKLKDTYTLKGKLVFIDNAVNLNTGTIQLKATYANEKLELWPGQFVKVKIPLLQVNNAVLAPTRAVQEGPNGSFVFTVDEKNIAHMVPVKISHTVEDKTIIESGLSPGMRVVTAGQMQLADGVEVQPVNEQPR